MRKCKRRRDATINRKKTKLLIIKQAKQTEIEQEMVPETTIKPRREHNL
jgi:hypothetical protein